jgi:hypothetical protein
MKEVLTSFLSGIGLLIFVYIVATNATKVATLTTALASGGGTFVKDLQGR